MKDIPLRRYFGRKDNLSGRDNGYLLLVPHPKPGKFVPKAETVAQELREGGGDGKESDPPVASFPPSGIDKQ